MRAHSVWISFLLLSLTMFWSQAPPAGAEPEYVIVDLGSLGTGRTEPGAVNEVGEVVGYSRTGESSPEGYPVSRAFLWLPRPAYGLPAGLNDLGTLRSHPQGSSLAFDINDVGLIVGSSETDEIVLPEIPEPVWRGFVWRDGVRSALPSPPPAPLYDTAQAVNEDGDIAVTSSAGFGCDPYLWLPEPRYGLDAGLHELPPLGALFEGRANDINDRGQIVGQRLQACDTLGGETKAYLWLPEADHGLPQGIHDVSPSGLPAGTDITATGLNDAGQVVGNFDTLEPESDVQGFLWNAGTTVTLPLQASAINERGWVVGRTDAGAALWRDDQLAQLSDLVPPGSGWDLRSAIDVNDRGQIVVRGVKDGRVAALLLDLALFFSDGFEDGSADAWSVVVP